MESEIELVGEIAEVKIIAIGNSIREITRLRKVYGKGRATVRLPDDTLCQAEIHWYEAHGIGRKDIKIKRILSE